MIWRLYVVEVARGSTIVAQDQNRRDRLIVVVLFPMGVTPIRPREQVLFSFRGLSAVLLGVCRERGGVVFGYGTSEKPVLGPENSGI